MAILKETPRSLRIFFIAVSIWTFFANYLYLLNPNKDPLLVLLGLLGCLIAAMYMYFGVKIKRVLAHNLGLIKATIYCHIGLLFVINIIAFLFGPKGPAIIRFAVVALLMWYILRSAVRVSRGVKSV